MNKETILVVDDDPETVELLAQHFLPRLGYETLFAYDGETAIEAVRTHQPDLMLLDFQLPDINGMDVLRRLASEERRVSTLLFTAYGSEQLAVDALRLGVQDYLRKPVDLSVLKATIAHILTETQLHRERAKFTAQLNQQITQLTVLSQVGHSVSSTLEVDEVLRRIVEAGVYLTQADEGFLALLDEEGDQLYVCAAKNVDQEETESLHLQVDDSLMGDVIRTGQPFRMTQSSEQQPLKLATGFLVRSLLHVPILSKGEALGVLSVNNRVSDRVFSKMDETLLGSLADYAAVAIENARLYDEATQRAAEITSYAMELEALHQQERQLRESLSRLRSTFLNAVGHELTTPVSVMIQTLETLADPRQGALNQEQEGMIEMLRQQALRLQRMIGGIVTFASFAAKQDDIRFHPTPLDVVLDDALQLSLFKAQRKEIHLEDRRPQGLPSLMLDGERISEALVNLVDNAVQFSPPNASVVVSAKVHRDKVEISVQDFGPGISEEEQKHIWDGFVQINRSLQRGLEGVGLGLAMTRHIIEAHGGTVSVDSTPGHGCTFTIALPRERKVTGILTSPFDE